MLQHKAFEVVNRARDRHIRLAVTGLSRSGKTAFITALVNQLEHAAIDGRLPLWDAQRQGGSWGPPGAPAKRPHPHLPTSGAWTPLFGEPPAWLEPTRGVAEVRLEIRYRTRHPVRRHLGRSPPSMWIWWTTRGVAAGLAAAGARLRAVERAGAWATAPPPSCRPWPGLADARLAGGSALRGARAASELAARYTDYLHACKRGARVAPHPAGALRAAGEYAGAPLLQFVPWVWDAPADPRRRLFLYATFQAALRAKFSTASGAGF